MKKKLLALAVLVSSVGALASPVSPMANFTPSNLSEAEGDQAWKSLRFRTLDAGSTCSNRANAWAYEMDQELDINSTKQFIHYSDIFQHVAWNYAKKPKYFWFSRKKIPGTGGNPKSPDWEYHVAPMITVEGEKVVLDKHFGEALVNKDTGEFVLDYKTREKIYVDIAGIVRPDELNGKPFSRQEWLDSFSNFAAQALNNPSIKNKIMSRLKKDAKKAMKKGRKNTLAQRALRLIAKSFNPRTGKYETKCEEKGIVNMVEHDQGKRVKDSWCHGQETSMYYWHPNSLRLLNYGFMKIPAEGSNINERNHKNGQGYIMDSWNESNLKQSYKEAFGEKFEF